MACGRLRFLAQYGFLKAPVSKISLTFLDEITKWAGEGSPVYVDYLDFQKDLDKESYQRLILTVI